MATIREAIRSGKQEELEKILPENLGEINEQSMVREVV